MEGSKKTQLWSQEWRPGQPAGRRRRRELHAIEFTQLLIKTTFLSTPIPLLFTSSLVLHSLVYSHHLSGMKMLMMKEQFLAAMLSIGGSLVSWVIQQLQEEIMWS